MDPEPLPVPFDIATVLWRPQCPFSSAVLSKGSIDATLYLKSELEWVNRIHTERYGWIVGCEITLSSGERFRIVSVHSPAFPIPRDRCAPMLERLTQATVPNHEDVFDRKPRLSDHLPVLCEFS